MNLPSVWCSNLKPFRHERALMILWKVPIVWLKGVGRLDSNDDEDISTWEVVVRCYIQHLQGSSGDLSSTKLALPPSTGRCRACSSPVPGAKHERRQATRQFGRSRLASNAARPPCELDRAIACSCSSRCYSIPRPWLSVAPRMRMTV